MTDTKSLREAATMALEALEGVFNWSAPICARPQLDALRAALALPDAEPVAWNISYTSADGSIRTVTHGHNAIADYRQIDQNAISTPLYAAPQPAEPKAAPVERKPLLVSHIHSLITRSGVRWTGLTLRDEVGIARVIEQAHGIKGAA